MFRTMKAASKRWLPLSILALITFNACEENTSVGVDFIQESGIQVDTLFIDSVELVSVDPYLGQLSYSAIGAFNDPLYGQVQGTAYFKPSINASNTDTILDYMQLQLRLHLMEEEIYGDTTVAGEFEVYRITNDWHGPSFRQSTPMDMGGELIGSFTDADADSNGNVHIPLAGSWDALYRELFNIDDDSTRLTRYENEDHGLAIVAKNPTNNLRFATFSTSRLLIIGREDTSSFGIQDWAYQLDRNELEPIEDRLILHNTFEQVIKLDVQSMVNHIPNTNFVRAELVLEEDTTRRNSSLGEHEIRLAIPGYRLSEGTFIDLAYQFGFSDNNIINGYPLDGRFRFDMTRVFNEQIYNNNPVKSSYIYPFMSSGYVGSNILYDVDANSPKRPRLIIHSIRSEEGQ